MARTVRIECEGAVYHVMCRGDRGESVFPSEGDRETFLDTLAEACGFRDSLVRADDQSLSFAVGDAGGESGGRDAVVSERVHATGEPSSRRERTFVSGPLQGCAGRSGGCRGVFAGKRLYPSEPGSGGTAARQASGIEENVGPSQYTLRMTQSVAGHKNRENSVFEIIRKLAFF
jgi:hypothetical protein